MDRLIEKILETRNPTVAGLDPRLSYVPEELVSAAIQSHGETLEAGAAALLAFNKGLIDALAGIVPAVKCQVACYEVYGAPGMACLAETIRYARENGLYVIADGKRNDIGSTAECYSTAFLGTVQVGSKELSAFDADCLTVNGYLGSDGILPFVKNCAARDRDLFALIKTSNPSSGQLQDRILDDGRSVYETMGHLVEDWGKDTLGRYGYTAVGGVVGATWPQQLAELREKLPHVFFLVPGFGAQGGGADDVKGAFDRQGLGAIVNNSRGLMCAYQKRGGDYQTAARDEAIAMRDALRAAAGL